MPSYNRIKLFILLLLIVVALDIVLCYRTYYIPAISTFVTYKYVRYDDHLSDKIKSEKNEHHAWIRFNYLSKSIIATRFAKPYQNNVDWVAMWPPDEIGSAYIINKRTKAIIITNVARGYQQVIDYHSCHFTIIRDIIQRDLLFNPDYYSPVHDIRDPYIIIINTHWMLSSDIEAIPNNCLRKAHLWHILEGMLRKPSLT